MTETAPERIRLQRACGGGWSNFTDEYGTYYIREDIARTFVEIGDDARDRIDALEKALREVLGMLDDPTGGEHVRDMRGASIIARAALGEGE